jgi:hypothetical protein
MRLENPEALGLDPDPANHVPGSPEAIFVEACRNAKSALVEERLRWGAEPAYCGFAWVLIKPARGNFVKFCKKHNIGINGIYGGWELSTYSFSDYHGQSMDLKEASARGFAKVLQAHGIKAWMKSRAD